MKRPEVSDPKSNLILDAMEEGKISIIEAKLSIPDNEKIKVIEYIHQWERKLNSPN